MSGLRRSARLQQKRPQHSNELTEPRRTPDRIEKASAQPKRATQAKKSSKTKTRGPSNAPSPVPSEEAAGDTAGTQQANRTSEEPQSKRVDRSLESEQPQRASEPEEETAAPRQSKRKGLRQHGDSVESGHNQRNKGLPEAPEHHRPSRSPQITEQRHSKRSSEPEPEEQSPPPENPGEAAPNSAALQRSGDSADDDGQLTRVGAGSLPDRRPIADEDQDPIGYWAVHGLWPPDFGTRSVHVSEMSASNPRKRPRRASPSLPSYSAVSRDGRVPPAHTAAAESMLAHCGIDLNWSKGTGNVCDDSRKLCQDVLTRPRSEPFSPCVGYPLEELGAVLDRLRVRNESRVVRDLTPLLVPSVENLAFSGHSDLDILAEDISADWALVPCMGGPTPRPDLTIGLSWSAFTPTEQAKLANYRNSGRATNFTTHVLFPFLICEVKASDQTINKATRQIAHSSAMAANALWQLHRSLEPGCVDATGSGEANGAGAHASSLSAPHWPESDASLQVSRGDSHEPSARAHTHANGNSETADRLGGRALAGDRADSRTDLIDGAESGTVDTSVKSLNGRILVFSIAHDNDFVRLYGTFPIFQHGDARPTFYRYPIDSQSLAGDPQTRTRRIRDFVLNVYFTFSKEHLARIRAVLGKMPEPRTGPPNANPFAWGSNSMGPPSQSASQMNQRLLELQLEEVKRQQRAQVEAQAKMMETQKAERDAERTAYVADKESYAAQMTRLLETQKTEKEAHANQMSRLLETQRAEKDAYADRVAKLLDDQKAEREAERKALQVQRDAERAAHQAEMSKMMDMIKGFVNKAPD